MKKILTYGLVFIVFISLIYAYSITTFSDGTSTGNMTFNTTVGSAYRNLSIPYWAVITKAEIDLRGYNISTSYPNLTVKTNNEVTYVNGVMNKTVADIDLNISSLQDCVNKQENISYQNKEKAIDFPIPTSGFGVGVSYSWWYAKNFTMPSNSYIGDLTLSLFKAVAGNLSCTNYIWIYSNDNDEPDEKILNYNISDSLGIGVASSHLNITFKERTKLTQNTKYWIVIGSNVPDCSELNFRQTNGTQDANSFYSTNQGNSWIAGTATLGFKLYTSYTYHVLCELNFSSSTNGTLEYSSIDLDYLIPFNITFKDETDDTLINGETFSVFLEKTDFSQIYSITSNPVQLNLTSTGLYDMEISSTNYLEREYFDINISESKNAITIYLINTTLGTEITFNTVDEALNPLEDVFIIFTRVIDGTRTIIAEENSDFAGKVKLDLDSNYEYTINFSKTNYETKIIELEPSDTEYVITMVSTVGAYNQSVYEGLRYRFEPSNTILNNHTKYNFTFTLNSSVWDITSCTLTLKNGTATLNQTSNFTSTSCYLRIEQDTASMTNITSEAVYELDSTYEFTVSQQYKVLYTYEGEFSLKSVLDDLSSFAMAGFDDFGRMMLALIVIFVITVLAAQKIGFNNPETLIFLVIAQVWFFSYVNWLYMDFTPIPTILGFDLKKYIIAILISLAGGAFVIKKFAD